MALKDWNKIKEDNEFTTYRRKKEDMFLTIVKQDYDSDSYGYNKKTDYIVNVGTHSDKSTEEHFKTKEKAIRFAERYMETN